METQCDPRRGRGERSESDSGTRYERALPIIPVKIDRDKISRAQAITPLIEAGKVFLPESAPWLADYVEDLRHSQRVLTTMPSIPQPRP